MVSVLNVYRFLCDCHYAILWKSLFSSVREIRSIPCVCLTLNFYFSSLYDMSFGVVFSCWHSYVIYYSAYGSIVPSLFWWKIWLDYNSLTTVDVVYCSIMFSSWFLPCIIKRVLLGVFSLRFNMNLYDALYFTSSFAIIYCIFDVLFPQFIIFGFHMILAYLKLLCICEYHTILIYSCLVLSFFRVEMYLVFIFVFVIIFFAYLSKRLFFCSITPRDLYSAMY